MVIPGHFEDGVVIPHDGISAPNGTEVIITVSEVLQPANDTMSPQEKQEYLAALARIDAAPNENAGDKFSGADHNRALYGNAE